MHKTSNYLLLLGFGLMLMLLLASSLVGLKNMSDINQRMDVMVKDRIIKSELLQKMRNYARERSVTLLRITYLDDPFELDEQLQHFSSIAGKWIQARDELMTYSLDSEMRNMVEEIYRKGGEVARDQNIAVQFIEEGNRSHAVEITVRKVIPGQNLIVKMYEQVIAYQQQLSQRELAASQSAYQQAFASLIIISIFMLSLGVAITLLVIRKNNQNEERKHQDKQEIEFFAYHDTLTGLPNRRLLMDRLQQEVGHSKRMKNYGAVLFIDIDNFKTLNDSLGHKFGDDLIRQVAVRISHSTRADDTVARLGGDEFVVILPALAEHIDEASIKAETIGQEIREHLSQGYMLDGMEYHVTTSIGITIIGKGRQSPDELIKQSDTALYAAKNAGRNTVKFYEKAMQEKADKRLAIERDIRNALFTGQFVLHYQPQLNRHGEMIGIEALVRWNHPEKGVIPPGDFICVAEESGLIVPMGIEILDNACRFLSRLEQLGVPKTFASLSINISPRQFAQNDFVDIIKEKTEEHQVDPSLLMLEITEGMLLHNVDDIIEKMEVLKSLSVRFSIDDFGTGYSSMQYLQRLPLDELKIDQSFVRNIGTNHRNAAIIETIIALANNLKLELVAEGVEEESQRKFLTKHGCERYQGYLFEKPIPEMALLKKYFQHSQ